MAPADLRGVPAVARGGGGVAPGTDPLQALLEKEERAAARGRARGAQVSAQLASTPIHTPPNIGGRDERGLAVGVALHREAAGPPPVALSRD
jgi:hypothetical protein